MNKGWCSVSESLDTMDMIDVLGGNSEIEAGADIQQPGVFGVFILTPKLNDDLVLVFGVLVTEGKRMFGLVEVTRTAIHEIDHSETLLKENRADEFVSNMRRFLIDLGKRQNTENEI